MGRLRDGHGKPVPKRLAGPFRSRDFVLSLVERLHDWETQLRDHLKSSDNHTIDFAEIHKHVYAIQQITGRGVPFQICDPIVSKKGWLSLSEASEAGLPILEDE